MSDGHAPTRSLTKVSFPVVSPSTATPDWMGRQSVSVQPARFGGQPAPAPRPKPRVAAEAPPPPTPEELERDARAQAEAELDALRAELATQVRAVEQERCALEEAKNRFARAAVDLASAGLASHDDVAGPLLTLAVEIAGAIVGAELAANPKLHVQLVESALALLDDVEGALLRCSREAHDVLVEQLGEPLVRVRRVEVPIVVDPTLEGFGCIAECGRARVDARVSERLRAVVDAFKAEHLSEREEIDAAEGAS